MPVRKVEVERFSLTTSRPFESVVSALKSSIGRLDLAAFASASKSSGTFAELEEVINRNMGESGLDVVRLKRSTSTFLTGIGSFLSG